MLTILNALIDLDDNWTIFALKRNLNWTSWNTGLIDEFITWI
nr:hypothetical protein [Mycoplasmopsis bovis]